MRYILLVIIINGLSYLSTIYLGNNLDPVVWGKITSGITIASTIAVFASFGRAEFDLREVSLKGEKIELFSILFSILVVFLCIFLFANIFDDINIYFLIGLSVLTVTVSFINVSLKVNNNFIQLAIIQKVANIFKIFLFISLLIYGDIDLSTSITIFSFFMILYFIWHLRYHSVFYNFNFNNRWFKKEEIKFLLNELSLAIYYQSGILVLSFLGMYAEVATYSLAILLLSGTTLIINAYFNSMILSDFYKIYRNNEKNGFKMIAEKIRICLILSPILIMLLSGVVFYLYPLMFNLEKYPDLQGLSSLFIIPAIIKLLYAPTGMIMNLQKFIDYKNKILLFTSFLCVFLSIILIIFFNIYGAFYAILISEFIILIAFNLIYIKHSRAIITELTENNTH